MQAARPHTNTHTKPVDDLNGDTYLISARASQNGSYNRGQSCKLTGRDSSLRAHTRKVVPKRKRRSSAVVECPFCGQTDELAIDLGGGERQTYTEDCAVCCRPRIVHVEPGEEPGEVSVWIEREE